METVLTVLVVLFAVLLVGCAILILYLRQEKKRNEVKWKEEAEAQFCRGHEAAEQIAREAVEKVRTDKEKYSEMEEKELLLEVLLSLGTYERRLDGIEQKVRFISSYRAYMAEINKQISILSDSTSTFKNQVALLNSDIAKYRANLSEAIQQVNEFNTRLAVVGNISQRVSDVAAKLTKSITILENISAQTETLADDTTRFIEEYGNGPMKALKLTTDSIGIVMELVKDLEDTIQTASSAISDVDGKIDKLTENVVGDCYMGYGDSVYKKVDEIEWSLRTISSNVDEAISKLRDMENRF